MRNCDMNRKTRLRIAILLLLLFSGLWTASYWRILFLTPADNMVFLDRGNVSWTEPSSASKQRSKMIESLKVENGIELLDEPRVRVFGFEDFTTFWIPDHIYGKNKLGLFQIRIPLWPPTFLLLVVVGWYTVLRRRWLLWRNPDACTQCGYNLTGNVSGVCPECGVRA